MAKTVTLNSIDPISFEYQEYSIQDDNLIVNFTVEPTFDPLKNYVAYYVYDLNDTVVFSNEINFLGYSIINGQVVLSPEVDIEAVGFEEGQYNVVYNFLNNELSSSYFQRLYIDQISSDRTEVRLNTTQISNLDLISGATLLNAQIQSSAGVYFDFFLDFGDNQLVIANNILLDTSNPEDPTVLIKLYEPLPVNFSLKDECWVVTQVANPVAYNINIIQTFELLDENIYLRGPNYNLGIKDQINNSTDYVNYSTLSSTSSYDAGTSSSLNYQINSILAERGVEINVDYSDYNNFIYFSSAETRLENFYYKLQLIEEYTYSASLSNNSTNPYSVTSSNIWQAKINEIITTFDGYDYFLYYDSGSGAWPKTNSTYPYTNASTANPGVGYNFFVTQSAIAIEFDENNNNALVNSIPQYLRDDAANAEYELFIEMLGEMFDNIWIYYQDVTNKWNADNRLNYGVSKDLVAEILRDLGLKIYQNNFSSNDLYLAFLGVTSEGNTFPFPNITGSYPVPSGYEYIDTKISASNTIVPLEDIEYSFYKRLYHNLPLLLKKKGTTTGLQNLITTYGIPSTILRVAEFGGKDKDETNDWDYYKQRYNYKLNTRTNPSVSTKWALNSNWGSADDVPNTLQFRFKLPSSGSTGAVNLAVSNPSQSLWSLDNGSSVALVLQYTGSGFTTGSYSGSIVNPYYQYANLKFITDGASTSASVYLPFFNGDWWSVMVTRDGNDFTLYAADNIYNGDDGTSIGFIASSSIVGVDPSNWNTGVDSYFGANGNSINISGKTYNTFSGSYQEIRYYTVGLSSSVFEDYTMNPDSIEGNFLNSAPDQLAFRASLGGELFTGSVSIHPKVTGSFPTTSSFASNSNFTTGSGGFTSNVETVYLDQPAAGIKNIVSNKIQIGDTTIALGNTSNTSSLGTNVLSQYRSIQQQPPGGSIYTENLAYTEIAFSPQNEINDDIMDQLGFFNMGEFIGDPRQRFNQDTSYPDLEALRNAYFEKYESNYNIFEYVNLIKYFDNSLFKMIKDFTPARASLASGIVIKQTLLERNKYPQPEVTQSLNDYSGSIDTAFILGGAGGSVNNLNGLDTNPYYIANGLSNVYGVTQSWSESIVNPYGLDVQIHSSQDEFYNGEFSGSYINTDNSGELNLANLAKQVSTVIVNYQVSGSNNTNPGIGEIYWNVGVPSSPPPAFGTQYVDELYINEVDTNGLNIQEAISNLNPGDIITFPIQYLLTFVPTNKTITGVITNISPIGTTIWRIRLAYTNGTDISYNPLADLFAFSNTSGNINLNPFLNNIGNWNSNDYNAIINNAIPNRLSEWYQQIDYATDQNIPINFQQLISGTAEPASVQDSNYTSYQYSGIRYWGSKNTTDNFNNPLTITSSIVQTYQNDNLGLTTLGYPSVNRLDATILQFDWGGGTYPQIINGGILALNNLLLVGADKDAIGKYFPQQNGFLTASAQAYPIGSYPVFNQYSTTVTTTVGAEVAEYGWTTPSVSNYYIPSGSGSPSGIYGGAMITSSNPDELYIFDGDGFLSFNPPGLGSINSQGFEVPVEATGSLNTFKTISSSLAVGGEWYVSMYYNLGNVASGTLQPITGSSELSQQGVYKLTSIVKGSGASTILTASLNTSINTNFSSSVFGAGDVLFPALTPTGTVKRAGLLIWETIPGDYMRVKNATLSGLGKGGLVTSTPNLVIETEFTYITQEYGTNPKNQ
jgi:hypothetical protein